MFNEIGKLFSLRTGKDTEKTIREYHKMGSLVNSVRNTQEERKKKKEKISKHGGYSPMCCNSKKICHIMGSRIISFSVNRFSPSIIAS